VPVGVNTTVTVTRPPALAEMTTVYRPGGSFLEREIRPAKAPGGGYSPARARVNRG
jgi:hypothetical protein